MRALPSSRFVHLQPPILNITLQPRLDVNATHATLNECAYSFRHSFRSTTVFGTVLVRTLYNFRYYYNFRYSFRYVSLARQA